MPEETVTLTASDGYGFRFGCMCDVDLRPICARHIAREAGYVHGGGRAVYPDNDSAEHLHHLFC